MGKPELIWHPYLETITKEMSQIPVNVDMLIERFRQINPNLSKSYDKDCLPGKLFEYHMAHLLETLKQAVPAVDLDPILKGEVAWNNEQYRFLHDGHSPMSIFAYSKYKNVRRRMKYNGLIEYDAVIRFLMGMHYLLFGKQK